MKISDIKQFTCSGGKAVPVNHFSSAPNITAQEMEFEQFIRKCQFACSPELKGVYGAEMFGEPVWQFQYKGPNGLTWGENSEYMVKEMNKLDGVPIRQFLPLKPQPMPEQSPEKPVKTASEVYEDVHNKWGVRGGKADRYDIEAMETYANQFKHLQPANNDYAVKERQWIDVADRLPEQGGRYWCYVIEINDLGKSGFQWNCYFDDRDKSFRDNHQTMKVTHWRKLMPNPITPNN